MISALRAYISGTSLGPTLIKAVTGSAGLRIAGMSFAFLVGVQLARGLGAEGYGIYGVAMSIIALLTVPTEFGLPQLLTREVASAQVRQDWARMRGILRWSSRVSLLLSLVIGVGVVAWLLLTGRGLGSPLGMTLLAGVAMIPVVAQLSMRAAALRGLQQIVRGQLPDVLLRPMFYSLLLFVVPLWVMPLTPALAMALGVASAAIALVLALHMLRKALPGEARAANPIVDVRSWWSSALPMAMTEGMRVIQGHLATLALGILAVPVAVANYRVAASIATVIVVPTSIFIAVLAPLVSALHTQGSKEKLQRLLMWTSLGMTLGVSLLALPFLVAGEVLLVLVFGGEYAQAEAPLRILCVGAILTASAGAAGTVLNMTGHERSVRNGSLLSLVVLLLLLPPASIFANEVGAAVATVIASLVWRMKLAADCRKLVAIDPSIRSFLLHR